MLDPKLIRNNLHEVAKQLLKKNYTLDVDALEQLEAERRKIQIITEHLQNERNLRSKKIGKAKAAGEDIVPLIAEMNQVGVDLEQAKDQLKDVHDKLNDILLSIPNIPHDSVPAGCTDDDNEVTRICGEPREFNFQPNDHIEIGAKLAGMDFDVAAKITGARFVSLRGPLAKMHRALTQLMLDMHTNEHEYQECYVPYIVNRDSLIGTGQLPKFEEELFKVSADHDWYLIPTAEVPLTNIARNEIIPAKQIPLKLTGHTPCFRSEAGSYGKDTRGMIRQHQFEKVELVQLVEPEKSFEALEELTGHAEAVLKKLELPYRVVTLCGGDLGFSATKTYDLEVWLPGQNKYREISSCSNCIDFQTRRMHARWRNPATTKPELLHTINGSGLAVGRTLIAVLENYQNQDGSVTIPDALVSYMGGATLIEAN